MTDAVHDPVHTDDGSDELDLRRTEQGGCVVLTVVGEVDMLTAPSMADALQETIAGAGRAPVVVDLSGVTFFSSTGLSVLLRARRQADDADVALRLVVGTGPRVRRVLQLTGLDSILEVHEHLVDSVGP